MPASPIAKRFRPTRVSGKATAYFTAVDAELLADDSELMGVLEAWPRLPDVVRAGIVAMVRAAASECEAGQDERLGVVDDGDHHLGRLIAEASEAESTGRRGSARPPLPLPEPSTGKRGDRLRHRPGLTSGDVVGLKHCRPGARGITPIFHREGAGLPILWGPFRRSVRGFARVSDGFYTQNG